MLEYFVTVSGNMQTEVKYAILYGHDIAILKVR